MFEQRYKEDDEENHADIWVLESVSRREKRKYKGPEIGEFLRLAKRPEWLEHIWGLVNCRDEDEEITESNIVVIRFWLFFFFSLSQ